MRPYSTKLSPPVDMIGQQLARVVETKNGSYPLGSRYLCDFGCGTCMWSTQIRWMWPTLM